MAVETLAPVLQAEFSIARKANTAALADNGDNNRDMLITPPRPDA